MIFLFAAVGLWETIAACSNLFHWMIPRYPWSPFSHLFHRFHFLTEPSQGTPTQHFHFYFFKFISDHFHFLIFLDVSKVSWFCSFPLENPKVQQITIFTLTFSLDGPRSILAAPASLYLHMGRIEWVGEWLIIINFERLTRRCGRIWSDNLQHPCVQPPTSLCTTSNFLV